MTEPSFVPTYARPDKPGISLNFDNTVSIYLVVEAQDTFGEAAGRLFGLIKEAQSRYPDWPRVLYVDIHGHEGDHSGFDADFFEFQQEFMFATMAPFLSAMALPLLAVVNPDRQRNDLPDGLSVSGE